MGNQEWQSLDSVGSQPPRLIFNPPPEVVGRLLPTALLLPVFGPSRIAALRSASAFPCGICKPARS
jgi:hypothetical protein